MKIDMTAEHLDWDPNNPTYSQQEAAMTDFRGTTISRPDRGQSFVINSLSSMTSYAADVTDNENFGLALDMQVTISVAALDTTKTKPGRIHSKAVTRCLLELSPKVETSVRKCSPPVSVGLVPTQ